MEDEEEKKEVESQTRGKVWEKATITAKVLVTISREVKNLIHARVRKRWGKGRKHSLASDLIHFHTQNQMHCQSKVNLGKKSTPDRYLSIARFSTTQIPIYSYEC